MFTRINTDPSQMVSVQFEGRELQVRKGLSIAAALLESGIVHFRNTPVTGAARAPFCMMGVCFECLLIVDGMPNQQACILQVQDGMLLQRQSGLADVVIPDSVEPEPEYE